MQKPSFSVHNHNLMGQLEIITACDWPICSLASESLQACCGQKSARRVSQITMAWARRIASCTHESEAHQAMEVLRSHTLLINLK